jgi:predicted HAD superfamily Cof-like phosphohydrolase
MRWTDEEKDFRIVAMQEELDEYMDAETKEDELDALLDLVIFAMGTAERQGMLEVFEEGFRRVMRANCNKNVGTNAKRGNFQIDLVKPEHWTAPVLIDLVQPNNQQELFGDKHGA